MWFATADGPTRGGVSDEEDATSSRKKCGCLKSSWRPSSSWWSSLLNTPSSHFLPWKQMSGNGDDAAHFIWTIIFWQQHWNIVETLVGALGGNCCNILLDKDLCHVKQFGKVGFQNKKSGLVILWLICVYSVGRQPSHTHNSRPLPDILYPPNGHCVLRALKQFILQNTQNIDHPCDDLSKAVACRKTELITHFHFFCYFFEILLDCQYRTDVNWFF